MPGNGVSLTSSTWIALAGSIGLILPSGGPVSFLYGFVFCVICNFALAASLGELAAIWLTAGGQYHFVYALCSERWKKSVVSPSPIAMPCATVLGTLTDQSFWVGWTNIAGWLTLVTTEGFFACKWDVGRIGPAQRRTCQ